MVVSLMILSNLENILKNEPPFRVRQAREAVFKHLAESWKDASSLPAPVREVLTKECPLEIKAKLASSSDGSAVKALVTFDDGLSVESVLMRHGDRNTVCVSSQVGCPLACSFCATGKLGFKRNLESLEIVEQVLFWARMLKKENARVSNVVFMGMGEPFLNYDHVLEAVRILNFEDGLNIGARHISISTAGIVEGIEKLASEHLQINLAISLHAPNDELRVKLMPIDKKYPLQAILKSVEDYVSSTRRKVMFEYIMIKGVNDSDDCARSLANLLAKPLYLVNLIRYNPTGIFDPSETDRVKRFRQILEDNGVAVTERFRFGREVKGACGQLAGEQSDIL